MEVVEEEERMEQDSARPLGGDSLGSPSARQRKRRSQSSGELHFDAAYYNPRPVMTTGDRCLSDFGAETVREKSPDRISVGVKPFEIQEWEDAIDYSWDLENLEDQTDSDVTPEGPRAADLPVEKYLIVEQGVVDEASSSASTPLMMQFPRKPCPPLPVDLQPPSSRLVYEEPSSPLLGLGIGPLQPVPQVSVAEPESTPVSPNGPHMSSAECFQPRHMRSPVSTISKSSSQESIILSIASSIIGTHRSSNSSASMSDFAHLANFGDSVENLKLELQDPGVAYDGRLREGSQETIREEWSASFFPTAAAAQRSVDPSSPFTESSPRLRHDRGASASQISIPERKSSMPGVDFSKAQASRRRAGTGNSRPRRNTRVSYSLFPPPPTPT
jgi:hypothetical protein